MEGKELSQEGTFVKEKRISFAPNAYIIPAIMGASLIIASIVAGYAFYRIRSLDQSLSVTGSARQAVTSDTAKWTFQITRETTAATLKSAYPMLDADLKTVQTYLHDQAIPDTSVVISPVYMDQNYDMQNSGLPRSYTLRQSIEVSSNDVAKITELSKGISDLAGKGLLVATQSLEYYYSALPDIRVKLLEQAMQDAKARAEKIANAGGRNVGTLTSASSGVVQVLSPHSVDISDYGTYDTTQVDKEVMVTVRATFTLR